MQSIRTQRLVHLSNRIARLTGKIDELLRTKAKTIDSVSNVREKLEDALVLVFQASDLIDAAYMDRPDYEPGHYPG